ncbi:XrtN system VIT domain-containing protein [Mucilaginibacter agri]|uniref:XrtN system VIT domain-containing protein n=1 Tax=Mucilaginibacter agri TaxID=2695265 RepID=A0A965ZI60_9SPHI|nr:XrtN system VIT domain-containing protein [Mucilaginibacter agri]NCD71150.1 XrtN system VIT domain-containing protein [Mucilaginibacter agri]
MKKILSHLKQQPLLLTGFLLIIVSVIVFAIADQYSRQTSSGSFFVNYAMSAGYLIALGINGIINRKWRFARERTPNIVVLLVLWFISAFALNREMNVFDSSVTWLSVWIVLSGIALMVASFYEVLPKALNRIIFFLLGSAFTLFTYYAIYLLPLYALSIVGIIAIGVSLHTYVPLCLAIMTIVLVTSASRQYKSLLYPAICGATLPLVVCACFLVAWGTTNKKINTLVNQNVLNEAKLPAWVAVSQQIENSFWTERILKTGLVYTEVSNKNFFWGGMPSQSFDEPKQHDPLVVIATLLFKEPNLGDNERIKILRSMYNARHQAQERLWSGDNLETVSVISNVKLFPQYRMAYTEKTLTVKNRSDWQWNKQEAIYTFHLSEGSVVSSLSLWIDGKEEKSRLTTNAKADSAYHEVVGVESHDPSVVHWQEGNTVSVRVFPCTPVENRRFKIGITSPLTKQGDRLFYNNASFDGPTAAGALETMQVTCDGNAASLDLPSELKPISPGVYQGDRNYQPDWQLSCKAPALSTTTFAFADTAYQVKNYVEQYESFTPEVIYLDINGSWSAAELDSIWAMVKNKPVYAHTDTLVRLSNENLHEVYNALSKQTFSLFPVNEIANPGNALLISESTDAAPNLNDLEGSEFAKDLTGYLKTPKQIRLYNIGHQLTPYLKALKELRVFNYAQGTPDSLLQLLAKHQFVKNQENNETVVLDNAQMMIQKTTGTCTVNAPDHLLRLFAYNDLMKKIGGDYFTDGFVKPDNIAEAEKAYIVSPVSSFIVLETQKDYERFGIDENKNSLKNASMKSSGAVPEPQEWLLIILCASVAIYLLVNKKSLTQISKSHVSNKA